MKVSGLVCMIYSMTKKH